MKPLHIKTISEFHRLNFLPPPDHPLISVVDYALVAAAKKGQVGQPMVADYYSVSVKRGLNGKMRYGQQEYDFDEGVMYFLAPGQVLQPGPPHTDEETKPSGWILLIHPDFLWNTPLAKNIRRYGYFDYEVHEALFLSDKEEAIINAIVQNIQQEARTNLDKFTQNIIISQLETLFNYAERFYQRQFITRKISSHKILDRLEGFLSHYFEDDIVSKGLPTVQQIADALHTSPGYLSGVLKALTGQTTQQHIHNKLIEKAKEKLSTTDLSVSEIAYELGFEHPQSFNKLFKAKTSQSPLAFRQSFN